MVSRIRSFMPVAVAALAAAVLGAAPAADVVPVTLAVAGRANANVSIAARDVLVVAAWGASREGAADVYAAVSRDGGRTFGAPVRVNATAGEAALGGERAPRVAIAMRPGGAAIGVLWTAKAPAAVAGAAAGAQPPGPVIRLAESTDLGRTFAAPLDLSGHNVPGIRGWAALAAGADGAWYAAWLDGRAEAAKKAAATTAIPAAPPTPAANAAGNASPNAAAPEAAGMSGHQHHHGGIERSRPAAGGLLPRRRPRRAGRPRRSAPPASASAARPRSSVRETADGGRAGARDMVLAWRHIFPNSERDIALSVLDPGTGRPGLDRFASATIAGSSRRAPTMVRRWRRAQRHHPRRVADAGRGRRPATTARRRPSTTPGPATAGRSRRAVVSIGRAAARRIPSSRRCPSGAAAWRCGTRSPTAPGASSPSRSANRRRRRCSAPGTYPSVAALDDGFVVAWTAGSGDAADPVQRLP